MNPTTTVTQQHDDGDQQEKKLRVLRLSEAADTVLRAFTNRKGDVSLQVNHAVLGTDLEHIEVIPRSRAPGSGRQTFKSTSVTFEPGVYPMVQEIAARRNISATALIDAAILQFFKPRAAGAHHVESDNSNGDKPKRRRR
ncbi:MAG: hypothetical protein Q4G70_14550 [Pseudomonadota bacterium]|nr:hypothetical protein [Pseudomonadota bacterium]